MLVICCPAGALVASLVQRISANVKLSRSNVIPKPIAGAPAPVTRASGSGTNSSGPSTITNARGTPTPMPRTRYGLPVPSPVVPAALTRSGASGGLTSGAGATASANLDTNPYDIGPPPDFIPPTPPGKRKQMAGPEMALPVIKVSGAEEGGAGLSAAVAEKSVKRTPPAPPTRISSLQAEGSAGLPSSSLSPEHLVKRAPPSPPTRVSSLLTHHSGNTGAAKSDPVATTSEAGKTRQALTASQAKGSGAIPSWLHRTKSDATGNRHGHHHQSSAAENSHRRPSPAANGKRAPFCTPETLLNARKQLVATAKDAGPVSDPSKDSTR